MPESYLLKLIQRKLTYKPSKKSPLLRASASEYSLGSSTSSSTCPRPSSDFPFHLDPKQVRAARHDSHPKRLPSPDSDVSDVRYFLYTLLTSRKHSCAKEFPEWVLETCIAWNCKGSALHTWSDDDLRNVCPRQALAVEIISAKHRHGTPCPPTARAMIGEVIAQFVCDKRASERQKEQVQQHWLAELDRCGSASRMNGTYGAISSGDHVGTPSASSLQALAASSPNLPLERTNSSSVFMSGARSIYNQQFQQLNHVQNGYHPSYTNSYNLAGLSQPFKPDAFSDASSMSSLCPGDSISNNSNESTVKTSPPRSSHELSGPHNDRASYSRRPHSFGSPDDLRRFVELTTDMEDFKRNLQEHRIDRKGQKGPSRYRAVTSADVRPHVPSRPSLLRTATAVSDHQLEENQQIIFRNLAHQDQGTHILDQTHEQSIPDISAQIKNDEGMAQADFESRNVTSNEQNQRHDSENSNISQLGAFHQFPYANTSSLSLAPPPMCDVRHSQGIDSFSASIATEHFGYGSQVGFANPWYTSIDHSLPQTSQSAQPTHHAGAPNGSLFHPLQVPTFPPNDSSFVLQGNNQEYNPMLNQYSQQGPGATSVAFCSSSVRNPAALYQSKSSSTTNLLNKPSSQTPAPKAPSIRPLNNFKVDTHALQQAERIRARNAKFAQTKAEVGALRRTRGNSLNGARSEGSRYGEIDLMQGTLQHGDPVPRMAYMNPHTGQRRATLIEAIEERERWDGKVQRGLDCGVREYGL